MNAPETSSPLSVNVRPDGVAVLTYDIPGEPVNTLRADFIDIFARAFEQIDKHPDVRAAVFISGKKDSFIAGADVKMLESVATAEAARAIVQRGHDAMAKLAASTKPIVAAVHGAALGGGFEVALACHARVLSNAKSTVLGLPEVQLGLLPGLSGLQRLAALTSLQVALDFGLTGKNMRPEKAKKLGVAEDVVPQEILLEVACKVALRLAGDVSSFTPSVQAEIIHTIAAEASVQPSAVKVTVTSGSVIVDVSIQTPTATATSLHSKMASATNSPSSAAAMLASVTGVQCAVIAISKPATLSAMTKPATLSATVPRQPASSRLDVGQRLASSPLKTTPTTAQKWRGAAGDRMGACGCST